jgi:alginate O-acetyltransferase complex protein AlgI
VYTLLTVIGGWVLFRCETLAQATHFYQALAGFATGDPLRRPLAEFVDPFIAATLLVGIVFATPLAKRIGQTRDRLAASRGPVATLVLAVDFGWLGLVFAGACAYLAAGTYNPFIYFRF